MSADWCEEYGNLIICGTRMVEYSRDPEGVKWCFHCRKRHEFFRIVMVPDGPSCGDPYVFIGGLADECSDLFPGWSCAWAED